MSKDKLKFWQQHLERLESIRSNQTRNSLDFTHTDRRIENAKYEISLLENLTPAEDAEMFTKTAEYLSSLNHTDLMELLMEAHMNDPDILENMKSAIIGFEEGLADCAEDE